jgi:preprotein translocase subunit SecG
MLYGIMLGIHVVICLALVLVVLLQSSKGGGLAGGSAFGGGAESTMFGGRGAATFLSKATTIFGVAFMVSALTLTLIGTRGGEQRSVVAEEAARAPVAPLPTAAPGSTPAGVPTGPALPTLEEEAAPVGTPDAGAETDDAAGATTDGG